MIDNVNALQATMRLDVSVMFTDETIELFHIAQRSGLGIAHMAGDAVGQFCPAVELVPNNTRTS